MPIYDYRCRECGAVEEILLRSSSQEARCPECGGSDMERLISASYLLKTEATPAGTTCCGRAERCEAPPCSTDDACRGV